MSSPAKALFLPLLQRGRSLGLLALSLSRPLSRGLIQVLLLLIGFYQRLISPGLRPCCRFVPSCSTYAKECLIKYGLLRGSAKSLWRLLRCHPLCKGGLDQP